MVKLLKILMPVEYVLVLFGALTCALYRYFDLLMPGQPGAGATSGPLLFYLKQFLTCLDLYALVLLAAIFLKLIGEVRRVNWKFRAVAWRPFWLMTLERFTLGQIFQDIRFFHAVLLMFVEFALLKNLVPHVNARLYDDLFIASDRYLCGGMVCSEVLFKLWGASALAQISKHYFWYYPYMSLTAFTFIAVAPRRLAQEYLCGFVLLFLVGIIWIYAVPTLGPVYIYPELFRFMQGGEISGLQESLWRMRDLLSENPGSQEGVFMISGFPSLHVAVAIMGSIYLRHIHPLLSWLSWIFTLLIFNSTIYLGWHYLLDDLGSVLLVALCIPLAKRVSWRWWGGTDVSPV